MFSLTPWKRDRKASAFAQIDPFRLIGEEFENLFGRFLGQSPWTALTQGWNQFSGWGTDVHDNGNEVVVRAELPGFDVKDIDVNLTDNVLTIEAKHAHGEGEENGNQNCRQARRAFTLPTGLDAEKIEAVYRNGVLELHVPRLPSAQSRKINIKS